MIITAPQRIRNPAIVVENITLFDTKPTNTNNIQFNRNKLKVEYCSNKLIFFKFCLSNSIIQIIS